MEKNKIKVYKLVSENLTNLGGPMGSSYAFDNWVKYFPSRRKAKKFAQKDYNREKINWKREGKEITSGDLLFVEYHIIRIRMEK